MDWTYWLTCHKEYSKSDGILLLRLGYKTSMAQSWAHSLESTHSKEVMSLVMWGPGTWPQLHEWSCKRILPESNTQSAAVLADSLIAACERHWASHPVSCTWIPDSQKLHVMFLVLRCYVFQCSLHSNKKWIHIWVPGIAVKTNIKNADGVLDWALSFEENFNKS